VLREALTQGRIAVVGEATTADETLELAANHAPDIVLMDYALTENGHASATALLHELVPDVRVVVMANTTDSDKAVRSLSLGADGYITKDLDMRVLPKILKGVLAGEAVISRKLTKELIEHLRTLPDSEVGMRPVKSVLTPREWEILDLLCLGQSTTQIADDLFVTAETVRSHVRNVLRKLGVSSRAEAVRIAPTLRSAEKQ
jgi:DNA-binding NarL/FixJ family response regulator